MQILEEKKEKRMGKEKCDESKPCDTCETGSTCSAKEKEEHEQARLQQKLFSIRHKIMVMSGKGGVGKTTVSANFAPLSSHYRVMKWASWMRTFTVQTSPECVGWKTGL